MIFIMFLKKWNSRKRRIKPKRTLILHEIWNLDLV